MSTNDHYKRNNNDLEEWLLQSQLGAPTPQITKSVATRLATHRSARLEQLLAAIVDQTEDETVDEWLQAWLADEISPLDTLPVFNFSFLDPTEPPVAESHQPGLGEMVRAGVQKVEEQIDRLTIHFSQIPQIMAGPQGLLGVRGKHDGIWGAEEAGGKIFQFSLPEERGIWGGEVSAFAENDQTCRVEIAVYRIDKPASSLANVAIVSQYDDVSEELYTDAGGVVEFTGIPRNKLAEITVHIGADG